MKTDESTDPSNNDWNAVYNHTTHHHDFTNGGQGDGQKNELKLNRGLGYSDGKSWDSSFPPQNANDYKTVITKFVPSSKLN